MGSILNARYQHMLAVGCERRPAERWHADLDVWVDRHASVLRGIVRALEGTEARGQTDDARQFVGAEPRRRSAGQRLESVCALHLRFRARIETGDHAGELRRGLSQPAALEIILKGKDAGVNIEHSGRN